MMLRWFVACVGTIIIALLLGGIYTKFIEKDKDSISLNYVAGLIMLFSIFQVILIPSTFLHLSFRSSYTIILVVIIGLCVFSCILNFKRFAHVCRMPEIDVKKFNWVLLMTVLIALLQMYLHQKLTLEVFQDDLFYVGTAETTLITDSLFQVDPFTGLDYVGFPWRYVMSPFSIVWAFLSKLFGVHSAIIARSIVPVLLLAFVSCVYYNIGKILFDGNSRKAANFLLFTQLIILFAGTGRGSLGYVSLLIIHNGKYLIAVALLPFCFYLYMRIFWQESKKADWCLLWTLMLACCLVSSMGILLGAICVGILGIVHFVLTKNIKQVICWWSCCIPNVLYMLLFVIIVIIGINIEVGI